MSLASGKLYLKLLLHKFELGTSGQEKEDACASEHLPERHCHLVRAKRYEQVLFRWELC